MTSHLDSHGTTDIKLEMLSGIQTRNGTPHDEYNIRGIVLARTNRRRLGRKFTYIWERGKKHVQ